MNIAKKLCFLLIFFAFRLPAQSPPPATITPELQLKRLQQDTLPIQIHPLPPRINTQFSEYNPILMSDSTFYFTSIRHEGEDDYDNIFEFYWYMRLFRSQLTRFGYSKPVSLSPLINNKKYFLANFSFNSEQNRLFLTRCKRIIDQELECGIWESVKDNNRWKKPEFLTRRINLPGTNTTQPFFVEYDDYAVLYFASDRPKGYGGSDIWYSIWKEGRFSDPVNLGSIVNSSSDEITPFYDITNNILYFSSNRPGGKGGYDIFYTEGALSHWIPPENIGFPLNSPHDDIYFSLNPDQKTGYLSSNRPTARSTPDDTCCYDIFAYYWTEERYNEEDTIDKQDTTDIEMILRTVLPITLYFHNDEPNPKSVDTITTVNYQTTLSDYIALKELYKKEYSKGLPDEKKREAALQIEHFFRDSVEKGFLKLEMITAYLLKELEKGREITIKISGYASALHQKEYNKRLTQRRIMSFINYLSQYEDGAFLPYLNGNSANKLTLERDPRGNEEAIQKKISDNIHDQRNSIYSISASLERRIVITEVEIKQ